ncbi:ankyrin repeat-containing domain protein [Baffinella frigidus]|nr:ankyrin repeat-containing domain protein [Cryptophyta sp. CCMP2293]
MVWMLLEKGANSSAQSYDGETPLHAVAREGFGTLKTRARGYCTEDQEEVDALDTEVVALLLEHNADVSAKSYHGRTPLHAAASAGHEAVSLLLLERGADVKAKSSSGQTPEEAAVARSVT